MYGKTTFSTALEIKRHQTFTPIITAQQLRNLNFTNPDIKNEVDSLIKECSKKLHNLEIHDICDGIKTLENDEKLIKNDLLNNFLFDVKADIKN